MYGLIQVGHFENPDTLPGVSHPLQQKIRKSERNSEFRTQRQYNAHNTPIARPLHVVTRYSLAVPCTVFHILCHVSLSPGLKSDILHENYLTHRQQPFASTHIFLSALTDLYYYNTIPHKLQAFYGGFFIFNCKFFVNKWKYVLFGGCGVVWCSLEGVSL